MCAPLPLTIIGGSPPTARNARTGELTPPGKKVSARCCSECERSSFLDTGLYRGGTDQCDDSSAIWDFQLSTITKKREERSDGNSDGRGERIRQEFGMRSARQS